MASRRKRVSVSPKIFYTISLSPEQEDSIFNWEYNIFSKTVESVNNFNLLYRTWRSGAKGGPSTHDQQDLYRAMLVFACAGLDVFVKQLVETKLPKLISTDKKSQTKFKEWVKGGMKKDNNGILNTVALALIDTTPRDVFLKEYIAGMTGDSLQSTEQLYRVADCAGLNTKKIFTTERQNLLRDAFKVRNEIIHEMDINISEAPSKTTGYRTRRQRKSPDMEKHTRAILDLAKDLFSAFKDKFEEFKIDTEKGKP